MYSVALPTASKAVPPEGRVWRNLARLPDKVNFREPRYPLPTGAGAVAVAHSEGQIPPCERAP